MRRALPVVLILAGCGAAPPAASVPHPAPDSGPPAATPPARTGSCAEPVTYQAGRSASGVPIQVVVCGRPDRPVVLFLASIHGDEAAGTPLLERLAEHLAGHPELVEKQCAVLVPVANPDGLRNGTRLNENGVDLNRNFPAGNFAAGGAHGSAPLSEPEAQTLFSLLHTYRPQQVVTIHMPAARIDYDGPAADLARRMAAVCDLPVKRMGARPGSLGSYVGNMLSTPIVTVELRRSDRERSPAELWERYGAMLLAALE